MLFEIIQLQLLYATPPLYTTTDDLQISQATWIFADGDQNMVIFVPHAT